MSRWRLRLSLFLLLPAALLIAALYLLPLVHLTALSFGEKSFSFAAYGDLFGPWSYVRILLRTFRLSFAVVAGSIVLGFPVGYVLAASPPRRRALLALLVLLPLWTSVLVRNFAWIYLLRSEGILSSLIGHLLHPGEPAQLLYNDFGVTMAMINTLLPFMVFPVYLALASQSQALREAAATLGARPAQVFMRVTLPLARGGIVAGSLFVFATAVGFFITPALLGGGRVLTAAIFINQQIEEFVNWPLAAAAAIVLLAIVTALVLLWRRTAGPSFLGAEHAIE